MPVNQGFFEIINLYSTVYPLQPGKAMDLCVNHLLRFTEHLLLQKRVKATFLGTFPVISLSFANEVVVTTSRLFRSVYNPWSIINFLDKKKVGAYWVNTSSNGLVSKLLREANTDIKKTFEELLAPNRLLVNCTSSSQ